MYSNTKKIFSCFLIVILLIGLSPAKSIQATISRPELVRVGINFKYGSTNSTLTKATLTSLVGIEVGYTVNDRNTKIFDTTVLLNSRIDDGSTSYHIKLSNNSTDLQTALNNLNNYKAQGLVAFLVITQANTFQVWEGEYYSKEDAEKSKNSTVKNVLGDVTNCSVVYPSIKRIMIEYGNGEPMLANDSSTAYLTFKSNFAGEPKLMYLNGAGYRGTLELRKNEDSNISVINELTLNKYLYGVVPLEIGVKNTSFEALKAQAVAARTYALANSRFTALGFDLADTTLSQVYGGYDVEQLASNNAVDATDKMVVTYGGALASLYYYSSSGGVTASSQNVWMSAVPYLQSVDDPYDIKQAYKYTFTSKEISDHLDSIGLGVGDVNRIEIEQVSESGRILRIRIYGSMGSSLFEKEAARIKAFPVMLPSQLFTVGTQSSYTVKTGSNSLESVDLQGMSYMTSTGLKYVTTTSKVSAKNDSGGTQLLIVKTNTSNDFVITGTGNGHGIGMSQYGAMGMAKAGYTYDEILKHYFTGVKVEEAVLY